MVENSDSLENIRKKVMDHPNAADILKRIDRIVECIDYEIDKYVDTRASVIFTGNLHPNTLFSMSSHTKFTDVTLGIQNVGVEINYIQSKCGINLEVDVCDLFYNRFSKIAIEYLDKINDVAAENLKELIINRDQFDDIRLIKKMDNLLAEHHEVEGEISKMIDLILQVDPKYKVLCKKMHRELDVLHNIDTEELSFDFIDYAVKFFHKIYHQTFGNNKETSQDDESSNKPR